MQPEPDLEEARLALVEGRCRLPFDVLGIHPAPGGGWVVRAFIPWARAVTVLRRRSRTRMAKVGEGGLFECTFPRASRPFRYRLLVEDHAGSARRIEIGRASCRERV